MTTTATLSAVALGLGLCAQPMLTARTSTPVTGTSNTICCASSTWNGPLSDDADITIADASGREVVHLPRVFINGRRIQLGIQSLKPGLHFLTLRSKGSARSTERFIVR